MTCSNPRLRLAASVSALAVGSAMALALGAGAVSACTTSGNNPPSPDVGTTQSLSAPLTQANTSAQDGCNGGSASPFGSGHDGDDGQSSGGNSLGVTGGSVEVSSGPAVGMLNQGGTGGNGSGDSSVGINTHAGSGGAGGTGGSVTLDISAGTNLSAGGPVIEVLAQGGAGGEGATGWNNGSGGAGAAGGQIAVNAAATVTQTGGGAAAIQLLSQGGAGGYQNGSGRSADNNGTAGGAGGAGGGVTLVFGGSVDALDDGMLLQSLGGAGGSGGDVTAGGGATGIAGGAGGGGGVVYLDMAGTVETTGTGIDLASDGGTGGNGTYAGAGAKAVGGNGGNGGAGGGTASAAVGGLISDTVSAGADGVVVSASGGNGGTGGSAKGAVYTQSGSGGAGGAGGVISLLASAGVTANGFGVAAMSDGGDGGNADLSGSIAGFGGSGGSGGAGGSTSVESSAGTTATPGIGIYADSHGGNGGAGGQAQGVGSQAGNGGSGGSGGSAAVVIDAGAAVVTSAASGATAAETTTSQPGVWVQSNGGTGGAGGSAQAAIGTAGGAGVGGGGGSVSATVNGTVGTAGAYAHGVLAQSVGGTGGNGNNAFGLFYARGSSGLTGGDGGAVTLSGSGGTIAISGTGAAGLIGQSVGGGGGVGGNALAASNAETVALGGNGGAGGDGQTVKATLGDTLITRGDEAAGLTVQSIGGAGGNAGSATSVDVGTLSLAIGGDGKGGGAGGTVGVANTGLVTTTGLQSGGIAAQSVGGGGGTGGAGLATGAGVLDIAFAVGGSGGTGGNGGAVTVTNQMQVTTYGSDSYGIKAQSISGGGGEGGIATSTALAISPDPEVPAGAMSVSIGGSGGAGGTASTVIVHNAGLVTTAGDGAMAMIGQSIAGGGGNGGDSSAWSYSAGDSTNISGSVSIGGSGGSGGTGGAVTMDNAALVLTTGESAYGMLGQSIGGGGGQGGKGDATAGAMASDEDLSLGGAITVGGSGGAASQGGTVTLTNLDLGGILTEGDGANAMLGQSIGGGGGAAGGGVGKANGGALSFSVTVGGSGGSGGDGGEVEISNQYALRTTGADADAMVAQSIGGGGGKGGKGASTSGGAEDPVDAAQDLFNRLGNGLGLGQGTETIADGVIKVGDGVLDQFTNQASLGDVDAGDGDSLGLGDDDDGDGDATSLNMSVSIGGSGGPGGSGGAVGAYNEGWIVTTGAKSDGIFVQSVGGGGGAGGAASSSDSGKNSVQLSVGSAGTGGGGGAGGTAQIENAAEAIVQTYGLAANGLVAQSVGGGGGKGGVAASKSGGLQSVTLALGGSGGATGAGGAVTVWNDVSAMVETSGKNAIGIVAQSVGGGGGIAHVLSKDDTGRNSGGNSRATADDYALTFAFGGTEGSSGNGGDVLVQSQVASASYPLGGIATAGRNAYGILAQSVGGGGGLAAGGQVTNTDLFGYGGSGGAGGDGGTVTVGYQRKLSTTGDGATGIWAQSIGGGGGIAGDTAQSSTPLAFSGQAGQSGAGGAVTVSLTGATLSTAGANAPVIFAQSVGGGGGQVTTANGAYTGTAGGSGAGGSVGIDIGTDGSTNTLTATGAGSAVVKAQSTGQTNGLVTVAIGAASTLTGASGAAALVIEGGSGNTVTNAGMIHGEAGGVISAEGGAVALTNQAGGWLYGDIALDGGTYTNDGEMQSNVLIDAASVQNNVDLGVGLSNSIPTTLAITGDLASPGTIYPDVDFAGGTGDLVKVAGSAAISGRLWVQPITLAKDTAVTVLTAGTSLDTTGMTTTGNSSSVYTYTSTISGNSIAVSVDGDFTAASHGLGATQQGVAGHLQAIWDSGASGVMGREFALIAGSAETPESYRRALDELSGQALGTIGASRHLASQRFVTTMNSCPVLEGSEPIERERSCGWARLLGTDADRDGSGDQAGFTDRATTLQIGGQRQIDDGWFLGGSLGYEKNSLDADENLGSADGENAFAGLVVKREIGSWTFSGGLHGGYGWYDTDRTLDLGGVRQSAEASPEVRQAGVHGRIAYQVPFQRFYLKSYVDLDATYLRTDGYTETGAGAFDLKVDPEHEMRFAAAPMVELGSRMAVQGVEIRPYAGVGAVFYDDNDWTTTARFVDAPASAGSFSTTTDLPETLARARLGVEVAASDRLRVRFEYDGQFGEDFDSQSGSVRLNWLF